MIARVARLTPRLVGACAHRLPAPLASAPAPLARPTAALLRAARPLSSTAERVLAIADEDAYNEALASSKGLSVVYFTAAWCGPCQMIKPIYQQMAEDFPAATFLKVDVDECPDIAAEAGIQAMPTFKFLKEGKVLDTLVGADPKKLLTYVTSQ